MSVNKVIYGENTLIDLTSDTVTADSLLSGVIAHNSAGSAITGTITTDADRSVTPTKTQQNFYTNGTYVSNLHVLPIPDEYIVTTDANASVSDIISGKTAYINGEKVTGTMSSKDFGNLPSTILNNLTSVSFIDLPNISTYVTNPGDAYYHGSTYVFDISSICALAVSRGNITLTDSAISFNYGDTLAQDINSLDIGSLSDIFYAPVTTSFSISRPTDFVAENVLSGKTFFGLTGTLTAQDFYMGTAEPASTLGNDGDLYLVVEG